MYCLKLTKESLDALRRLVGFESGSINLNTGVIKVETTEEVHNISEHGYAIDNVNRIPFENCKSAFYPKADRKTEQKENLSKIFGNNITVGSLVRTYTSLGVYHVIIIKEEEDGFVGAKVILGLDQEENGFVLKKNEDILFRNSTYKSVVQVTFDFFQGITEQSVPRKSGGLILGKLTNEAVLKQLQDEYNTAILKEAEEKSLTKEGTGSGQEIVSGDVGQGNEIDAETADIVIVDGQQVNNPEENPEIISEKVGGAKMLDGATTFEEIIQNLGIPENGMLALAIKECIDSGRVNLKKLYPLLQRKYKSNERLSQNAVKVILTEEFEAWLEASSVTIEETTISDFLRAIVSETKK